MKTPKTSRFLSAASVLSIAVGVAPCAAQETAPHFIAEAYPAAVQASRQNYRQQISAAGASVSNVPFYILVPTVQRWRPGQVIRVAFSGGNQALHAKVAGAASAWLTKGGANLSFSFTDGSGKYRAWTPGDASYSGEIRIAFKSGQEGGYWSHVGTDSVNKSLEGGAPGQASMNLDSFDRALPSDWEAVVIHEFGHALGFEHEHQNPAGGCDFRFDDDPGYVQTKDSDGWYTTDPAGKRPGLYTYLGGYANFWPREKVDHNLRALPPSSAFLTGAFDKASVMKYFFDAFMFKAGNQSPCYTPSENLTVSAQDAAGVQKAYPKDVAGIAALNSQKRITLEQLRSSPAAGADLKQHVDKQMQGL